jgi:hypothetical protein
MPDPTKIKQAKKLIGELARGNGWISERNRQKLSILMPDVLESVDGARRLACSSTQA